MWCVNVHGAGGHCWCVESACGMTYSGRYSKYVVLFAFCAIVLAVDTELSLPSSSLALNSRNVAYPLTDNKYCFAFVCVFMYVLLILNGVKL